MPYGTAGVDAEDANGLPRVYAHQTVGACPVCPRRSAHLDLTHSSANSDRCASLNPGIAASISTNFAVRYPRTFADIAAIAYRDFPRP